MNLFDQLVNEALTNNQDLSQLRVVVEKELLHHDILLAMSEAGLLENLCFIGGTCLRACYGSNRLSEDLNFTGGADFNKEALVELKNILVLKFNKKYGLQIDVNEPTKETGNVDTWKLLIQTRPERKDLPAQRIHLDICSIPSYQKTPRTLLNLYGVNMGTQGLILNAQTLEEIYIDKILDFALRRGRIKNRDLWDLLWLKQQGIKPDFSLIKNKLQDHKTKQEEFITKATARLNELSTPEVKVDFRNEMQRFLPTEIVKQTVHNESFWVYLVDEISKVTKDAIDKLLGKKESGFLM